MAGPRTTVAGGVLAGGASRRMGGEPKALLPWPPGATATSMLDTVLLACVTSGITPVAIVTGTHHDEIGAAASAWPDVPVLFNARHPEGQLTSLWCLLDWAESLPEPPAWLLVTLVDMPAITPATLTRLVAAADAAGPGISVVRPTVGARHGHPLLWHRRAWPRLRQAPLAEGARPVVHALVAEGSVLDVPVDDEGVLRDIDSPDDYGPLPDS